MRRSILARARAQAARPVDLARRVPWSREEQPLTEGAIVERLEVRRAVASLSPPQQEAIALLFYVGATYTEAARLLGRSREAIRLRRANALKTLRTRLTL